MARFEAGNFGTGVRMDAGDAPQYHAAPGEIMFGTHHVYDNRGAIVPTTSTRERIRPEQVNWGRVLDMVAKNPDMDVEAAKRASVMKAR